MPHTVRLAPDIRDHEPVIHVYGLHDPGPRLRIVTHCSCGEQISERILDASEVGGEALRDRLAQVDGRAFIAHCQAMLLKSHI